jgi:CrcB protein
MAPEDGTSAEEHPMHLILIGIGGFAGAVSRYLVDGWVASWTRGGFPWGTMAVNLSGSLLLGLAFALAVERAVLPSEVRGPLMIGFIGAYTTFSTLALESWRLLEDGAYLQGVANLGGSVVLGLAALVAGIGIGRALA